MDLKTIASDDSLPAKCRHCGTAYQYLIEPRPKMQKKAIVLLVFGSVVTITLLVVILGCSSNRSPPDTSRSNPNVATPTTPSLKPGVQLEMTQPKNPRLRVIRAATYNINWANRRLDAVLDAIRQSDADIVCLQETNPHSANVLRREFSPAYSNVRFYGSVERYAAAGFGLLSRFPIKSETFLPAQYGLFGSCLVELENGDQTIRLIVVHLQPVVFPRNGGATLSTVWSALQAAEQTHRQEMEQITAHISVEHPTLVVGDFNSCSTFQAPVLLTTKGFVDSFASVTENPDSHPTWHWPTSFGEAALRVDYIFHSPAFRTRECRLIETEGSDHYLLLSKLEMVDSGGSTFHFRTH